MAGPVYALNLFNVADKDEYLAYSRRSAGEVQKRGGRVVALGRFRESALGDLAPRQVLILVDMYIPGLIAASFDARSQVGSHMRSSGYEA